MSYVGRLIDNELDFLNWYSQKQSCNCYINNFSGGSRIFIQEKGAQTIMCTHSAKSLEALEGFLML